MGGHVSPGLKGGGSAGVTRNCDGFAIVHNEKCITSAVSSLKEKIAKKFQILSCGFHKVYDTNYYTFYHMLTKCLLNDAVIVNLLLKAALHLKTFRKCLSEKHFPKVLRCK